MNLRLKTFHKGGIHPDGMKTADAGRVKTIGLPERLFIPLSQHIGKPAVAIVKPGDEVEALQLIARADGFVSAPIHAPVTGKIEKIDTIADAQGNPVKAIILKPDADALFPAPCGKCRTPEDVESLSADEIVSIVAGSGITGMGGAAFPTAVKLTPPKGCIVDTVAINGAECEPCLTCDETLMRLYPAEILAGARLLKKAVGAGRILVGIENNKLKAIEAMRNAASGFEDIQIVPLVTKYPQGGEKQLIAALTGREVPSGKLPADVGVVVDNVATARAVYQAVYQGRPLVDRIVTLTTGGDSDGNYLLPIGMPIADLLTKTGSRAGEKILAGGPMMGRAISRPEAPVVKGFSGLTTRKYIESTRRKETHCIRCGGCVDVCPMGLEPYLLEKLSHNARWEDMVRKNALDCIECGSCQWKCPSNKPLLDYIRLGKFNIRKMKR